MRKIYIVIEIRGKSFASSLTLQSTRDRIMQNGGKVLNNFNSNKSHITKKSEYSRVTSTAFHVNAQFAEFWQHYCHSSYISSHLPKIEPLAPDAFFHSENFLRNLTFSFNKREMVENIFFVRNKLNLRGNRQQKGRAYSNCTHQFTTLRSHSSCQPWNASTPAGGLDSDIYN